MSNELLEFVIQRVANLTSAIDIYKEGNEDVIEVLEHNSKGISIATPKEACQLGHLINLEGILYLGMDHQEFACTGKITETSEIHEKYQKVVIHFHTYDQKLWLKFNQSLLERQKEADDLFFAMKGD